MLSREDFNLKLGKKIKEIREDRNLSLDKLGEKTGLNLDKSTLSAIENGKRRISAFQLYIVAEALNVKMADLFREFDAVESGKELASESDLDNLDKI